MNLAVAISPLEVSMAKLDGGWSNLGKWKVPTPMARVLEQDDPFQPKLFWDIT